MAAALDALGPHGTAYRALARAFLVQPLSILAEHQPEHDHDCHRPRSRLVYRVLGNRGMLCARYVRGSTTNISNHSWGTAIDLTIENILDTRGDDLIQFGLHLICGIKGFAEGSGVIVNTAEGLEPMRFYGGLVQGSLSIGVLQTTGGFMAGRWANGVLAAPLPDGLAERNVAIQAFDVGAAAATAVSKSLAKKDARASSFYAEQARNLREQTD